VAAQGAAAVPYPSPKPHSARAGARREAGRQGRLGLGNRLGRARAQQPVYVRENLGAEDFRKQQHLPGRHTVGDRAWPGAALLPGLAGAGRRRALRLASGRAAVSHTSASTTPSQPVPSTWTAPWRAAQRRRAAGAWAPRRTCRPSTALLARAHSRQPPVSFTSTQLCTNVPAGYKMRGETEPCH